MKRPLIDFTFGIKAQAMAVLHELAAHETSFEVENISTRPWYNGRERGILICVQHRWDTLALCVAVFEHRISDSIVVRHWDQEVGINIPTGWEHCNRVAYDGADRSEATFACGEASKAARHVIEGIERWVKFEKLRAESKAKREAAANLPGIDEIEAANAPLSCKACGARYLREVGRTGTRLCKCGAPVDSNPGHLGVDVPEPGYAGMTAFLWKDV